jgi:Flp pilus assembly pilin Flp
MKERDKMRRTRKNKRLGQGMTEYLLIVGLIAISSVAVVTTMGKNLKVGFAKVANAIGGHDSGMEAERVDRDQYAKKDMGDFDDDATFGE